MLFYSDGYFLCDRVQKSVRLEVCERARKSQVCILSSVFLVGDISVSFIYSDLDLNSVCGGGEQANKWKCAKHQKGSSKLVYQTIAKKEEQPDTIELKAERDAFK